MTVSGIIMLVLFFVQLFYEKLNEDKKKEQKKKTKTSKPKIDVDNNTESINNEFRIRDVYKEYNNSSNKIKKQPRKKMLDRESEILDKSYSVSSDKILNDLIFSEILKKPKSKR